MKDHVTKTRATGLVTLVVLMIACSDGEETNPGQDASTDSAVSDVNSISEARPADGLTKDHTVGVDHKFNFSGFNNGVVVSGQAFPGSEETKLLRKQITVTGASGTSSNFQLSAAYISRKSTSAASETSFYAMIPIKNVSARPYCFITVDKITYKNAKGASLASVSFRDVTGSVARFGTVYTSSCLAPGETGYFCDVQISLKKLPIYSQVTSAELTIGADKDLDIHDPDTKLVPKTYTYHATKGLELAIKNDGAKEAQVHSGAGFYIILAADGKPLWFHYLKTANDPKDAPLAAGKEGQLLDPNVHFKGGGDKVMVFLDFAVK